MMVMFDAKSPKASHEVVCDRLANEIHDGQLTPGTELPPARKLASAWGVSWFAVEKAYAKLAARGYLVMLGNIPIVRQPNLLTHTEHLSDCAVEFTRAAMACGLRREDIDELVNSHLAAAQREAAAASTERILTCG